MFRKKSAAVFLTVGLALAASAYDVIVPVGGYRLSPEKSRCEFDSVKKLDSGRIVFGAGEMMRTAADGWREAVSSWTRCRRMALRRLPF